MSGRYHWKQKSRRSDSELHNRWLIALALTLVSACVFDWLVVERTRGTIPPRTSPDKKLEARPSAHPLGAPNENSLGLDSSGRSARVVYPYSVIPGGVHDVRELKDAIAKVPVVSMHFAAFRLARTRIVRLDRAQSAHVSYRLGDRVYWTKRELKLAKGETLITDGVLAARTRCGNMISATIAGPVSPNEPPLQELNRPESLPAFAGEPGSDDRFPPLQLGSLPGVPGAASGSRSSGPAPIAFVPSAPILYPPTGSPSSPNAPVVNTPEPGTAILLLTALLSLLVVRGRRQSAAAKTRN